MAACSAATTVLRELAEGLSQVGCEHGTLVVEGAIAAVAREPFVCTATELVLKGLAAATAGDGESTAAAPSTSTSRSTTTHIFVEDDDHFPPPLIPNFVKYDDNDTGCPDGTRSASGYCICSSTAPCSEDPEGKCFTVQLPDPFTAFPVNCATCACAVEKAVGKSCSDTCFADFSTKCLSYLYAVTFFDVKSAAEACISEWVDTANVRLGSFSFLPPPPSLLRLSCTIHCSPFYSPTFPLYLQLIFRC